MKLNGGVTRMNNIKKRLDHFVGDTPRFTVSLENRIVNEVTSLGKKQKKRIIINKLSISLLFAIAMTVACVFVISITTDPASNKHAKVMTDEITKPTIEFVEPSENTFIIEYGYDNMDRGNHDFLSIDGERPIIIEKTEEENLIRGDIIYYEYPGDSVSYDPPEYYLSRIVGLPGETVEIIDGQVFIDNQKLETFYGKSSRLGMDMETYFTTPSEGSMLTEEDFKVNLDPIKIPKNAVFVLSDDWIRGTSSIHFGPLDISKIEGKVLGYIKE